MKVTLTFEGDELGPKTSLKVDLPIKWMDGPLSRVCETFVKNYEKKNPSSPLKDCHLTSNGTVLDLNASVGQITSKFGHDFLVWRGPPAVMPPPFEKEEEEEEEVFTKKGIEKAISNSAHAFDYSKWEKLDLSDDDGLDCHPNIELASWKRIKAQQRAERRLKEQAEIKRLQDKIHDYELAGNEALVKKYKQRLADFEKSRKWIADDVCDTVEDRSVVTPSSSSNNNVAKKDVKKTIVGPENPDQDFYETYESYIKQHEQTLRKFAAIENNREATQEFMEKHPEILVQHADGFLLLLCLDTAMRQRPRKELVRVVTQHLMLNYVLELAKLSKLEDARAAVKPFFVKTAKQNKEQFAEFDKELTAFVSRIEARAKEKLSKGEPSPLAPKVKEEEEEEYERAEVGPGGLDPTEVLQSLPKDLQDAFVQQDVAKLKEILSNMDHGDADYHLKRCIAAGLWVVPPGVEEEEEEE